MDRTPIEPHLTLRDRYDARLQGLVLCGSFLTSILCVFLIELLGPLFAVALLVTLMIKLLQVTLVRVDAEEDGIRLVRLFGRGRLIRWDEIESIEEIGRQTYLSESLRCLFTRHLCSASLSFTGNWRIRLKSGQYALFPPADRELFERKVVWKRERKVAPPAFYRPIEVEEQPAQQAQQVGRKWWQ